MWNWVNMWNWVKNVELGKKCWVKMWNWVKNVELGKYVELGKECGTG